MEKAINQILADRFLQLLGTNELRNPVDEPLIHALQQDLINGLSESQLLVFEELDDLLISAETKKMESSFRIGFLEGLKVGGAIL